ncbi:MAG: SDR family oxidoreductase [Rickettsiales bacterium]
MDLGLKGKRAIVTGGSKGIGRRIVDLLVSEGCHVGFCARNESDVDAALAALSGGEVTVIGGTADVTDDTAFRAWMTQTAQALGGVDILVANASSLVVGADEEAWRTGLEVDILGTVRAVESALPYLEASECGSIVAISSTAAVNVSGGVRAYSGVKAALISYMSGLSTNMAAKGIRANTVSPGAVYFEGGVWERNKTEDPERFAAAIKRNPMGRFCTPEEVANGAVFLASPAASYISGVNLVVDGAATTRIQY